LLLNNHLLEKKKKFGMRYFQLYCSCFAVTYNDSVL
jgi:hypothetical protein